MLENYHSNVDNTKLYFHVKLKN